MWIFQEISLLNIFLTKFSIYSLSLAHAGACYCIHTALDLITQITSAELYKTWSSSSGSLLHSPVPNIPHTPAGICLMWQAKCWPIRTTDNIKGSYFFLSRIVRSKREQETLPSARCQHYLGSCCDSTQVCLADKSLAATAPTLSYCIQHRM
jgi:hypothetical protein